jgi:PiT family inorganic phosphate transporter
VGIGGVEPLLIGLIVVALAFDFMNGMNDAANSIATIVATRVLSPRYAVAWAAFFNFVAFLVFGLHVAKTVGTGIVSPHVINDAVIFGALAGAISWNIITQLSGIPSSSSHALIGGLIGAGIASAGFNAVVWAGVAKTAGGIVWSPTLGIVLALFLVLGVSWMFVGATPARVDGIFRRVQFVSASLFSLGHGGNDAQKTMGVIAVLLFAHGYSKAFEVPFWVVLLCQGAMAFGTLFGGWRIVRTMGSRITRLTPLQGVCAETAGSIMLFLATGLGIPVSSTHTITGAIIGVGAARRASAVRWGVARRVVIAWVITMPAAGVMGALFYEIAHLFLR